MRFHLPLHKVISALFVAAFLIPGATLASAQGRGVFTFGHASRQISAMQAGLAGSLMHMARASAARPALHLLDVTTPAGAMNPWTNWPDGTTAETGVAADITKLDDQTYSPFVLFHTSKYAGSGVLGGYLQTATVNITSTQQGLSYWLGTYYPTAAAASARVDDMVSHFTSQSITGVPCISTWTACHLFAFSLTSAATATTPSTQLTAAIIVYAEGNAVGETLIVTSDITDATTAQALGVALGKIGFGGDTALKAASGPGLAPTVGIDSLTLSHKVKSKLKGTATLKSGEKGLFEVSFHTTNSGVDLPTGTIVVLKGTKQIVSGALQAATKGTSTQIVLAAAAKFTNKTKKAIHLTAQVLVTLGASTDTKSLTFTVKPKP